MRRLDRLTLLAALCTGIGAALAAGPPAVGDLTLPAQFRSMVMVLDAHPPGTVTVEMAGAAAGTGPGGAAGVAPSGRSSAPRGNSAFLTITIDRWSTEEEQASFVQALKSGGTLGLVSEMEKSTVGYLQIDSDLRWPIRLASTWKSFEGRVVRLATNGPILFGPSASRLPAREYPIGIVEFTLPDGERSQGTLVAATRAEFDDRGRISATVMPVGTGVQRLTNVERADAAGSEARD
jgi:hypothetical protein